jgi:hypothetical protein
MNPEVLKASSSSQLEINVYAVNMVGFKTPFSGVQVRFVVEEGKNLVELSNESPDGKVTVRSRGTEGEAIIGIYSLKSGAQISRVLVKIMPRDLA